MFLLRESSHTIALHNGLPVALLHAKVDSRWLVIPVRPRVGDPKDEHWVTLLTNDLDAISCPTNFE